MKLGLQQQNFYELLVDMRNKAGGWELVDEAGYMSLKSPVAVPLVNFVWGEATIENIEKAKKFFGSHSYAWLLNASEKDSNLLSQGARGPEYFPEMLIELKHFQPQQPSVDIEISEVVDDVDFEKWAMVASETFKISIVDLHNFFLPLIKFAGCKAYIAYYNGIPAGTSLVYCKSNIAGIYAMSVVEKFRRKTIGRTLAQACLEHATQCHVDMAVLYSSGVGELLYSDLGFKSVKIWREYLFN